MSWWNTHAPLPGSPEALEAQKQAIARRGHWVVSFAHGAAVVILIVFSAGSLVGLTGEALTRAIAEAQGGVLDIPRAIEVMVSTLLVPAMDMAMFYAAIMIRLSRQRRQDGYGLHTAVVIIVSLLESATFIYMSAVYDNPGQNYALWMLIVLRGVSAPGLATYLSLAATPPVSSRDILYLTESLAADGVLNDTALIAYDPTALTDATLRAYETRLAIWFAVAEMPPDDRARLDALRMAVQAARAAHVPALPEPVAQVVEADPNVDPNVDPNTSPDGPGGGLPDATRGGTPREPSDVRISRRGSNLRTFTRAGHNPRRLTASAEAARRARAMRYLDAQPDMPKAALRRKLRCAKDAADGYWSEWYEARAQSAQAAG